MKYFLNLTLVFLLFLQVNASSDISAHKKHPHAPICRASDEVHQIYIAPRSHPRLKSAQIGGAKINVSYIGFPANAQTAFAYAVSIWQNLIHSPVTINILAKWEPLETGVLGSCAPSDYLENFDGAPLKNYYYPTPLAEKLAGKALNADNEADIVAHFNSNNTNWYYGTDGKTPADKYDLVSVVLHEIAHGLGFNGLCFKTTDNLGAYGWNEDHPAVYDDFMTNLLGKKLVDQTFFPNFSALLFDEFKSGYLKFNGDYAKNELGGSYPRLYAPTTYDEGSSLYHLNESIYPYGNAHSLMTPQIGKGEAIHDPGIALAILEETGWLHTSIVHTELKDSENSSTPLVVKAVIRSDTELDTLSVKLIYTTGEFTSADTIPLVWQSATDEFSATIPVNGNATIRYYLQAADKPGKVYRQPAHAPKSFYDVIIGPDQVPPTIVHQPVKYVLESNPELFISALVDDNIGVGSVKIEYAVNKSGFQQQSLTGDNNNYSTTISLSNVKDGDFIFYRLIATDASSQALTTISPTEGYNSVSVHGFYNAVTSYRNEFNSSSNDFISSDFYIGKETGFDNGCLNSPHPYPSPNANNQSYDLSCILKHPITIVENGKMSFDEVVLVEPGEAGTTFGDESFWDYVIVEGSPDGQTNWLPLTNGYDSGFNSLWQSAYTNSENGTSALFVPREILLTGNGNFSVGQTIFIRFRLFSDPFANAWGWAIDNLIIQDVNTANEETFMANHELLVYPNPTSNMLHIEGRLNSPSTQIELKLLSLTGQIFLSRKTDSPGGKISTDLDLSKLPAGIYLLEIINPSGEKVVRKVVRN